MSTEVSVVDETSLQEAIADVRSDATETDWVLVGHADGNPNVIEVIAVGSDGIEGFVPNVDESQVMYGLLRISETIDMSKTTKFAYIRWIGDQVSFVKRGKYGVVSGSVEKFFNPFQVVVDADSKDDLEKEKIMSRIQETSGTKNKVLEACEGKMRPERGFTSHTSNFSRTPTSPTASVAPTIKKVGGHGSSFSGFTQQAKGSSGLNVEEDVRACIKEVRSDASETTWCVAEFEGNNIKNPLSLTASGAGEPADMAAHLTADKACFALIRMTDVVDDIPTVKFVYIQWVGEGVKPMAKAKLATKKGALEELFAQFHVNIYATTPSEVSQRALIDKVSSASGSKSHVK